MFVCCECCVLSGRGLCDELITCPEESYRLWCVVVCHLETSRICAPYIYGVSTLRVKKVLHSLYYTSWVPKLHCPRQLCKSRVVTLPGRAIPIFVTCIKIPPAALTLHYIIQYHRQITAPSVCKVRYHCFNRMRSGKCQSGYLWIQYEWNLLHLGRTGQHSSLGPLPISVACLRYADERHVSNVMFLFYALQP